MVERDDRPPLATFYVESRPEPGATARLDEAHAHHARVRRLESGDFVRLTDGAGRLSFGTLGSLRRGELDVAVESVRDVPRPPAIHLRVPIADRDRMLWLAEKSTELGIATWQAVRFHRSNSVSPRGEGDAFAARVRTRMIGALEQSGGAWLPEQLPDISVADIVSDNTKTLIVLDVTGEPLLRMVSSGPPPVLMVGPEGGLEREELEGVTARGWRPARLADTTLRFETAAVAALGATRAVQLSQTVHGG